MQLKIYDILASLIPGTLVFGVLLFSFFFPLESTEETSYYVEVLKGFSGITTTVFLTISYLIGYLIHALGSWLEPILWWTWGGRPSELLLKNKSKRLSMVFYDEVLGFLIQELNLGKQKEELVSRDYKFLFQIAKNKAISHAGGKSEERLSEFNNSYIFSRNILVAILLSYASLLFTIKSVQIFHLAYMSIGFIILLMLWYRSRDKAIYYSREILTIAYSSKSKT